MVLHDPDDNIQNRKEDSVKARMFSRLVLKSCNFVLKIKPYQFLI